MTTLPVAHLKLALHACCIAILLTLVGCEQSAATSQTAKKDPISAEVLLCSKVEGALRTEVCFGRLASSPSTDDPDNTESAVRINVELPARVSSKITADQRFWVGLGRKAIRARIRTRSDTEGNSAQRFVLEPAEDINSDQWSAGQVVEVRFFLNTGETGFWLPLAGLQRGTDGQWCVFAVKNEVVTRRKVDVKFTEGEFVLVSGNLSTGDMVITDGGHRLVPGQRVQPVNLSATMILPFQREAVP